MNASELAMLLVKIQLGDHRQVDPLVVAYWDELIGHLDYEDAQAAVRMHRIEKPGVYLEPGHVYAGAKRAWEARKREERRHQPHIEPQVVTLDRDAFDRETENWITYYRELRAREAPSQPTDQEPLPGGEQ
jgi:hypothetical protein